MIRIEELEGQSVLLLDDGHCFRDQAIAVCGATAIAEATYRATSLHTLVQMAAPGHSVTLLPGLAVGVENRRQDLRLRNFASMPPTRTIALVRRRRAAREVI